MNNHLLPPNATQAEQAMALCTTRLSDIPVSLGQLWHADTCPAALLPWLAWTLSVDEWDSQWNEATQRQVIQQSTQVHRKKGTVGAVKQALKTLGVTVDFLEWFEDVDDVALAPIHSGTPHTFVFIAWANQNLYTSNNLMLNEQLYSAIDRVVTQTKPIRSHFKFLVGAKLTSDFGIGSASTGWLQSARFTQHTIPVKPELDHVNTQLALVTSGHNLQVARWVPVTEPTQVPSVNAGLATYLHLNQRRYLVARYYLI